ncbi:MFS transporter [Aureibaculum sp. 2210JD6-5]|uniref:MFS transporter n=1 Tax=Aureibaculum sp. 2210JD6-5 TaxID=3103957 RepID=UPI002AAD6AC7|nr:MFS transporter [Aureibaculum sp. 2210JD6-5]MDY7396315.1 MFS transporter [Aureibaculum sp. 2210JD6-5]
MKKQQKIDISKKIEKVPFYEKTALGIGALSMFFGYASISILAYPVYNILLGVNAAWIGIALMVPRIWDSITDPIMGKISDNFQSKWGRRKPFIILGAITMGILFALLWLAPQHWSEGEKLAYFIVFQLLFFTAYTIFSVPLTALSYEMTPDYHERTRVMSFMAFFHKLGELLGGWMLPLATSIGLVLVVGATDLNMEGVIAMALIVGVVFMALAGALPGIFVKERFKPKAKKKQEVKLWDSIKGAFSSKPFLLLVIIVVLNVLSGVLAMGIDQYILIYFMNDGNLGDGLVQKALLTTGYGVIGFISIPVISFLAKKFDKKGALFFVYSLMAFGGIMKWFIFTPGHTIYDINLGFTILKLDPIILIDPLLCGPMWVAVKIMLGSMMADICDEDELQHGQRREGIFGAVFSWLEKMMVSLAYLGTGLALSFAAFNPDLGGDQTPETFTRMRLFLAGAPTLTAVLAIVAVYFYPINAARAQRTSELLEERNSIEK